MKTTIYLSNEEVSEETKEHLEQEYQMHISSIAFAPFGDKITAVTVESEENEVPANLITWDVIEAISQRLRIFNGETLPETRIASPHGLTPKQLKALVVKAPRLSVFIGFLGGVPPHFVCAEFPGK